MALQGHYLAAEEERARRAEWMSYLLSAQTGTVVTKEQLLGTEEEVLAAKEAEGNAAVEQLLARMPATLRAPQQEDMNGTP